MNITKVSIKNLESGNLKAMVTVEFDNCFVLTGLKVMGGSKGLFISMPLRKTPEGEYKDTAFPITKEFRETLINTILEKYSPEEQPKTADQKGLYPPSGDEICPDCHQPASKCDCLPF